jgi:hypothetical protein
VNGRSVSNRYPSATAASTSHHGWAEVRICPVSATHDAVYRCSATTRPASCAKAKSTNDAVDLHTDQLIPGWIGAAFITPRTAVFTLLAAASLGSNYMVDGRRERVIAGLQSRCPGTSVSS